MMSIKQLARLLGGEASGPKVLAPGPGHSNHDRSMVVFMDATNPDGFRVHSFSGDDWKACRDHVKARLGISDSPAPRFEPPRTIAVTAVRDESDRTDFALRLWHEATPITGTPAAVYLASRGIDLSRLPEGIGDALRWHPACAWEGGRHGAMIGLLTDAQSCKPKAIHRTAITTQGQKIGKKMLGPSNGCVVRLWPDEAITTGLVLGEGIETTLAAATRMDHRGTSLIPAWAACSAGAMAKFPPLLGVECLTILVDHDKSGAGQRAAMECAGRWNAAGIEVTTLMPPTEGEDFADVATQTIRGAA